VKDIRRSALIGPGKTGKAEMLKTFAKQVIDGLNF